MTTPTFHRRRALTGAAAAGLGLPVLAACSGDDETPTAVDPAGQPSSGTSTTPAPSPSPSTPTDAAGVATTADVPVGGGLVLEGPAVVLTQPAEGELKCFTAVCTHTGCLVASVTTTINCPCHGSTFDITTGEVLGGPASAPLAEVPFTLDGDQVVLS